MITFAREKTQDHGNAKASTYPRASDEFLSPVSTRDLGAPSIFRKASCSCGGGCPACQAKSSDLKVSSPNDPAEIEADRIADRVMRMPITETAGDTSNAKSSAAASDSNNTIHRKCSACESEDDKIAVQRKPLSSAGGLSSQSPAHVRAAIGSGGRPLDLETRGFFEPRLGYDLSRVRIHTGDSAAESAGAIKAKAYTLGSNIVFGNGEYKPHSESGRHLLAHELAHTVQQQTCLDSDSGQIARQMDAGTVPDAGPRDASPVAGVPGDTSSGVSGAYDGDGPDVEMPVAPPSRRDSGVDVDEDRDETTPAPMGPTAATAEITLETGNTGAGFLNNLVHQQICVDRPSRAKLCFSFAAVGAQAPQFSSTWLGWDSWVAGAILKGQVYDPSPVSGATITSRHTPTVAEATNWLDYMTTSRLGIQDGYSVARHNCRLFSQWEFRDAPSHY